MKVTDVKIRESKLAGEKSPIANVDVTFDNQLTIHNMPAWETNGKLSVGDKMQIRNGKSTGFHDERITDLDLKDQISMAATAAWKAIKNSK